MTHWRMRLGWIPLLVVFGLLLSPRIVLADLLIDSFSSPSPAVRFDDDPVTPANPALLTSTHSSILGTRVLGTNVDLGTPGDVIRIGYPDTSSPFSAGAPQGTLRVSSGSTSLTTTLTYTFSAQDFAAAGDSLDFAFNFVDDGPFHNEVSLKDSDGDVATVEFTLTAFSSSSTPKVVVLPLTNFTATNGNVDLNSITEVQVKLNNSTPQEGADFILSNIGITAVPEPATFLLWGLFGGAGIGLGFVRRKRRA